MTEAGKQKLKTGLLLLLGAAAVWLFLAYVLKWVLPFVIALLIAGLLNPAIGALERRLRVRRGFAAFVCIFAALLLLGAAVGAVVWRVIFEIQELIRRMPELLTGFSRTLGTLGDKLMGVLERAPESVQRFLAQQLESAARSGSQWAMTLTERLLGWLSRTAGALPSVMLGVVTTVLATFFTAVSYERIRDFCKRQIPRSFHGHVSRLRAAALVTFGKWLKAQLLLMLITFCELAVAFCVLRVQYAVVLALVIALLDALPVLGTGMILVPWAAVKLLDGAYAFGAGLLVTYAVVVVVHNCVEPKLVSAQLGLDPLVTLASIYVGFRAAGVAGMILFPVGAVAVRQLHRAGYIRLWR